MFKKFFKKAGEKKGFTLAELLIVVAIIGVLVAISVPIFTSQLSKSRKATNQANIRSAQAAAVAKYMEGSETGAVTYSYDTKTGTITSSASNAPTTMSSVTVDNAEATKLYSSFSVTVSGDSVTVFAN